MLRRGLMTEMRKRFRALRAAITRLIVDEDAFGLRADRQAGSNAVLAAPTATSQTLGLEAVLNASPLVLNVVRRVGRLWYVYGKKGKRLSRGYPTKAQAAKRLGQIEYFKRNEGANGILTINTRWRFETDAAKVGSYQTWLKQQVDAGILEVSPDNLQTPWMEKYIRSSYKTGLMRAYTDTHAAGIAAAAPDFAFMEGGKAGFLKMAFNGPIAEGKMKLLSTRSFSQLKGVTAQMDQEMSRILADGIAAGKGPRELARTLTKSVSGLEKKRALAIARTEIIHAHAEGQLDAFEAMNVEEVGVQAEWSTASDDRVCFPAWTTVTVDGGYLPIQKVAVGTMVATRAGLRRVVAVAIKHHSNMVALRTTRGWVVPTDTHLFWHAGKRDWVEAGLLEVGDLLQFEGDECGEVLGVVKFSFGYTADVPTVLSKVFCLARIAGRVLVPVCAINLQCYAVSAKNKINGILTNLSFLGKRFIHTLQRLSHYTLNGCFSGKSAVAAFTTKSPGRRRANAEFSPTVATRNYHCRASAFFRAVVPIEVSAFVRSTISKWFVAPFAAFRSGPLVALPASYTTEVVPVGDGNRNGEHDATTGAYFVCRDTLVGFVVADARAVFPAVPDGRDAAVCEFPTSGTGFFHTCFCRCVVALAGTVSAPFAFLWLRLGARGKQFAAMVTGKFKWHGYALLCWVRLFGHLWRGTKPRVYDIQVDDQPEFYAGGALVHNCPLCQPLEGVVLSVKEARGMIPRHINCRCAWIPAGVGEHKGGTTTTKHAGPGQGLAPPGTLPTGKTTGQSWNPATVSGRIRDSIKAEHPKLGPKDARAASRWTGADLTKVSQKLKPGSKAYQAAVGAKKQMAAKALAVGKAKSKARAAIAKKARMVSKTQASIDLEEIE